MPWQWPVGAVCAFLLTLIPTSAGVSGAVLLLPIQLSILHVPSPAVMSTNLLFNVAAIPGGLLRFRHERRLNNPLTGLLVAGTLPGVIAGARSASSCSPAAARSRLSPPACFCRSGCGLRSAASVCPVHDPSRLDQLAG